MVDERSRDRDPLLLAAGERVRKGPVMRLVETDVHQRLPGARAPVARGNAGIDHRQFGVLQRRGAGQQIVLLKDEAELGSTQTSEIVGIQRRGVDAVEKVLSRRRAVEAADDVHERRLPRAGWAHDRRELAGHQGERHVVNRRDDVLSARERPRQGLRSDRRYHGDAVAATPVPSSTTTRTSDASTAPAARTPTLAPSIASTSTRASRSVRPWRT